MYVYRCLVSGVGIPRLKINLDLTTACLLYSILGVVLVDYSITTLNLLTYCVFMVLRRKLAQ